MTVTVVPPENDREHVVPQLIPLGLLVTVALPLPLLVTWRVNVPLLAPTSVRAACGNVLRWAGMCRRRWLIAASRRRQH